MNHAIVAPYSKLTYPIGRVTPTGIDLLGTGFMIRENGLIATTHHVIGNGGANLVICLPNPDASNGYQDLTDTRVNTTPLAVVEIDPLRDIAVLKADIAWDRPLPVLSSFDDMLLGQPVAIFGYPHCPHGRRAFTLQQAEIGAKVLMGNMGILSKHAVINVQARPGQSGSPVVDPASGVVLGMLVGAWVPGPTGLRLGDINPYELHQTTHCIGAQHIKDML